MAAWSLGAMGGASAKRALGHLGEVRSSRWQVGSLGWLLEAPKSTAKRRREAFRCSFLRFLPPMPQASVMIQKHWTILHWFFRDFWGFIHPGLSHWACPPRHWSERQAAHWLVKTLASQQLATISWALARLDCRDEANVTKDLMAVSFLFGK